MTTTTSEPLVSDAALLEHLDELGAEPERFNGYAGYDFESEVQQVADVIHELHPTFFFGFEASIDRTITGGTVSVPISGAHGIYLMRWVDLKFLTDNREATGRDAAIAIKSALLDAYRQARSVLQEMTA